MPVVQIVDVARMHHRGVPTAATMGVGMVGVRATAHASSLSPGSIQFWLDDPERAAVHA
jgi:hypothetical protein